MSTLDSGSAHRVSGAAETRTLSKLPPAPPSSYPGLESLGGSFTPSESTTSVDAVTQVHTNSQTTLLRPTAQSNGASSLKSPPPAHLHLGPVSNPISMSSLIRPRLEKRASGLGITSASTSTGDSEAETASNRSAPASVRSGSLHNGGRFGIFGRRGSLGAGESADRRPKSTKSRSSNRSTHSNHSTQFYDDEYGNAYEMADVSTRRPVKRIENVEAKMDRIKAEASMQKWRRWIVEQPDHGQPEVNPLFAPVVLAAPPASSYGHADTTLRSAGPAQYRQASSVSHSMTLSPPGSRAGPSTGSISATGAHSEASHQRTPSSSSASPSRRRFSRTSLSQGHSPNFAFVGSSISQPPSLSPFTLGTQDIYMTESVAALRDVELAVDPEYLNHGNPTQPADRGRRLSTHPRISDLENPFVDIDALLSRRGIRPYVLELVHALGAYVDAVWCTTYPGQPCPWAGIPILSAAQRASIANGTSPPKTWKSWTITAVQEGKRKGFFPSNPTEQDVEFWERETRYGLRDTDEAVNRRKDLGWAFGEAVIKGQYGEITRNNVLEADGGGANIPRLLNDLEEALWGDALPAPTDLAFEYEDSFCPFGVYREGDELIGTKHKRSTLGHRASLRDAELLAVFGDYLADTGGHGDSRTSSPQSPTFPQTLSVLPTNGQKADTRIHAGPEAAVTLEQPPSLTNSSNDATSVQGPPRTPAGDTLPDLDMSVFGALQELSLEEKLELGRKRHAEYMERVKREEEAEGGLAQ